METLIRRPICLSFFLLQRFAVDFAEVGVPCFEQAFLDDPAGEEGYKNRDACTEIDENLARSDSNEVITQ